MSGPQTVAVAGAYWARYYAEEFHTGQGLEQILNALTGLPAVWRWADLGAGSESLLWSIPLRAASLVAIDADPERLAILRTYAAAGQPRGMYRHVLDRCGRTHHDFTARCEGLDATLAADCLAAPPLADGCVQLLTQFGLLGLTAAPAAFTDGWQRIHRPLEAGGWCAGANWVASRPGTRVRLGADLYRQAAAATGIHLHTLTQVPVHADPDFTAVWIYTGRKHP